MNRDAGSFAAREPIEPDIARALTARLLAASPTAELAHVVLAILVAAVLIPSVPWSYAVLWAAAITVAVVAWVPWRRRAGRGEPSLALVHRGLRPRVMVSGLLWGLGVAWLALHGDLVHVAAVLVVCAGLVAGGLVTLMADPVAFRLLLACTLGPPAVALLAGYQSSTHIALAVLMVVFGLFEANVHRRAFLDLLAHERAKLRIRDNEERLWALENATTEGIVLHEDGIVLDVNDAFLRMGGYEDASEVTGRPVLECWASSSRETVQHALQSGTELPVEADAVRRDGTVIMVELASRAARYRGRVVRMTAVRDVTARKHLEAQLEQSQKMELVGQMAGGLAHDFNNLVTAILASADLMEQGLPPDALLQDEVSIISRAARRGAELTRRLLAFSRRQPLEVHQVELASLADEFCGMARRLVPADVAVQGYADRLESTITADPGAIVQVLTNLVTNARDAMPRGGHLRISVERRVLTAALCEQQGWGTPGDYVTLAVSDTGVGMTEEVRRRIFEPFFTTKPSGEGSGLGMAMVYGLVLQHDGHVEIDSVLGRGTTVRLFFPATAGAPETVYAPVPQPARGGSERILLVEDEEVVRRAATKVLQKFGYDVAAAADGVEAMDLLERGPRPDLIVADVVMPRLNGPDLVRRLEATGPPPRVLFTSGYAAREFAGRAPIDPRVPFLAKPWEPADLVRKVREILDAPAA